MKQIKPDLSTIIWVRGKASNPNTDPDELVMLFMHEPEAVLSNPALPLILLENPRYVELLSKYNKDFFTYHQLPPILLDWLHNNPSSKVWENYAQNPFISVKEVEIAMKSANPEVRFSLARNDGLSKMTLKLLSIDEDSFVRSLIARNKRSDKTILEKLAKDPDDWVRRSVAKNPRTPINILEKLAKDPADLVRLAIARNPRTLPKTLKILARDNYIEIRFEVLDNPTTPWWLSIALLCDRNPFIRRAAKQTIQDKIQDLIDTIEDCPWYFYIKVFAVPVLIIILTMIVIWAILFSPYLYSLKFEIILLLIFGTILFCLMAIDLYLRNLFR
ncbi:MAG: HEAT repeat domain-containing protein [Prochloraceae cyanobacterium]